MKYSLMKKYKHKKKSNWSGYDGYNIQQISIKTTEKIVKSNKIYKRKLKHKFKYD